jgi:hypothetical protein
MEIRIEVPEKENVELPYGYAIPLLHIYPKECNSVHNRYLHTHVYSTTIHNSQVIESA